MGLDIQFLYGAKIHECENKKETGEVISVWKNKTERNDGHFHISCLEVMEMFKEITFKEYECPHLKDGATNTYMQLRPGYTCFVSNGFVPGEIVEFSHCNGFYYGSYFAWHRDVGNLPAFFNKFLSDCAGYYTGTGLLHLRNEMAKYKNEKSESFNDYYTCLEEIPEDALITSTIVRHC